MGDLGLDMTGKDDVSCFSFSSVYVKYNVLIQATDWILYSHIAVHVLSEPLCSECP